jgi:hypothetical protein
MDRRQPPTKSMFEEGRGSEGKTQTKRKMPDDGDSKYFSVGQVYYSDWPV